MADYHPGLAHVQLPAFHRIHQHFPTPTVEDLTASVQEALAGTTKHTPIRSGLRVGIAVGSRGIRHIATITKLVIDFVKKQKCEVIIIPAMGSHGGATAAGQKQVLADYGITESHMGVSIVSTMNTRIVGGLDYDAETDCYQSSPDGALSISLAQDAWDCDMVIPIVRIKPHTGFRGPYESGICKMLSIGLGKHAGCSRYHRAGYDRFAKLIPAAAQVIIDTGKIGFSLAVLENAVEQTAHVCAVSATQIMLEEPPLLERARQLMPRLLIPTIDVLIVEQIGKNISGTGMDPNITGRGEAGPVLGFDGPLIKRIVVLGITPESHGNAAGIGLADLITESAYQAIDKRLLYTNILTSGSLDAGKIPITLPDESSVIRAAMSCIPGKSPSDVTIVRIKDTLHLQEMSVSENLLPIIANIPDITIL